MWNNIITFLDHPSVSLIFGMIFGIFINPLIVVTCNFWFKPKFSIDILPIDDEKFEKVCELTPSEKGVYCHLCIKHKGGYPVQYIKAIVNHVKKTNNNNEKIKDWNQWLDFYPKRAYHHCKEDLIEKFPPLIKNEKAIFDVGLFNCEKNFFRLTHYLEHTDELKIEIKDEEELYLTISVITDKIKTKDSYYKISINTKEPFDPEKDKKSKKCIIQKIDNYL